MAAPMEGKQKIAFNEVTEQTYAQQAQFFLNAFWAELGEHEAETIWGWHQIFLKLDLQQHNALMTGAKNPTEWSGDGNSLDEFWSHKFLEDVGQTLTVVKFRQEFKEIDINFDKKMAMLEFLLWHYQTEQAKAWSNVTEMLKRPQGTNEELKKAQKALKAVQEEIARIEKEKADLEKKSEQPGVKGKNAKASLAQLLAADQTELNRITVTAEAAVRKAQKAKGLKAAGALWWLQRELTEAKKYKPSGKRASSTREPLKQI
eukprot:g38474.t1